MSSHVISKENAPREPVENDSAAQTVGFPPITFVILSSSFLGPQYASILSD
jgi:hypothetical protein